MNVNRFAALVMVKMEAQIYSFFTLELFDYGHNILSHATRANLIVYQLVYQKV